eukprot:PITA_09781
MTSDKNLFNTLEEKDLKMHIEMGDDGKYSVSRVGIVAFQREHGVPITLKDVKYVYGIKKNLVSVTMLEDKGYDVVFSKRKVLLRHIATGQTKRIGIQKKDQTFSKFCELKDLVKKESRKKIKALRSDNNGEYVSQVFKEFCAAEGIKRELTAPHNPQQNGVAKRKNKTIVGVAWVILHEQGLPLHLWAEACNTIFYFPNRSSHRILWMKTPKEAFSSKRLDVGHFKNFGSSVYFHVTKDAQKKIEPTTELGILVGYTDTPHKYRVYSPTSRRTVVRRDLMFDEQKGHARSLERDLKLQAVEELMIPKEEERHTDVE